MCRGRGSQPLPTPSPASILRTWNLQLSPDGTTYSPKSYFPRGWRVGRGREDPVPRSLAQPAWVFSLRSRFPRALASSALPPPKPLGGRGRLCPQENSSARQAGLAPSQGPEPRQLRTRTSASKTPGPRALSPLSPATHTNQGRQPTWAHRERGRFPPSSDNTSTKRYREERSDKGALKSDRSWGAGDRLKDGV